MQSLVPCLLCFIRNIQCRYFSYLYYQVKSWTISELSMLSLLLKIVIKSLNLIRLECQFQKPWKQFRKFNIFCSSKITISTKVCIRVLQRNRTNRMCVGVCVCVCVYIYRIPSCSGEFSLCSVKTFNWLDKAHPYYRG